MNKEGLILITKRQAKKLGSQAELAREVGIQCAELITTPDLMPLSSSIGSDKSPLKYVGIV